MTSQPNRNSIWVVLHTLIIYLWTIVSTIVLGTVAVIFGLFSKTGNSVHFVARVWGRSILWISGIRVEVSGLERIDANRSLILMSNHQSNFDIPVLLSALPLQFRWLAKAELFKIPIFGRGMRGAGYISIDRSDRKSAFRSLARAAQAIREGTSVLIFPEGTRSFDGLLLPFKKGGFVLAVDAGVPILPLVIEGTVEIMAKGCKLIRRRPVLIKVRPEIDSAAFTRKTKDELIGSVREAMTQAMADRSQRGSHA